MSDFNAMAEKLFGATTPTGPTGPSGAMRERDLSDPANKMFPNQEPAWRAIQPKDQPSPTDAEVADKLFGGGDPMLRHGDAGRAIERAALEDHLADPEEARETAGQWLEVFDTFQLSGTESAKVADLGASVFANPPTPQMVESWVEESKAVLQADYGTAGAAKALDDARLLVQRFGTPELIDVLNSTGLGNHPAIIRMAAQKARALRAAGRL